MIRIQATEDPTGRGKVTGGVFRWGYVSVTTVRMLTWLSRVIAEHGITEVLTEYLATFLVRLHGNNGVQLETENDFHQKVTRRQSLTVAEIGRVRIAYAHVVCELLVGHHAQQYGGRMTFRQRTGA